MYATNKTARYPLWLSFMAATDRNTAWRNNCCPIRRETTADKIKEAAENIWGFAQFLILGVFAFGFLLLCIAAMVQTP